MGASGSSGITCWPGKTGRARRGSAGTYEWWYFDARLDDGAKLVVVFFTKNFTDISRPLVPIIRINLDLPDGRSFNKVADWKPEEFAAARDRCDVHIGDNSFSGDLHSYKIIAHVEDIAVDITLVGTVPASRAGPEPAPRRSDSRVSTSSTGCPRSPRARGI